MANPFTNVPSVMKLLQNSKTSLSFSNETVKGLKIQITIDPGIFSGFSNNKGKISQALGDLQQQIETIDPKKGTRQTKRKTSKTRQGKKSRKPRNLKKGKPSPLEKDPWASDEEEPPGGWTTPRLTYRKGNHNTDDLDWDERDRQTPRENTKYAKQKR